MTGVAPMETLSCRIGTAHDLMQYILKDPGNEIDSFLWGALSGVEMILRQVHDDADELLVDVEKQSTTIIDKNVNLEHYGIFLERLDQARSTVIALAAKDPHHHLDGDIACSLLSAANVVRRRAKDALESVSVVSEEVQS